MSRARQRANLTFSEGPCRSFPPLLSSHFHLLTSPLSLCVLSFLVCFDYLSGFGECSHTAPIWQLSWAHPSFGPILASASYDGKVLIWKEKGRAALGAPPSKVAASKGGYGAPVAGGAGKEGEKWEIIKELSIHGASGAFPFLSSFHSLSSSPHYAHHIRLLSSGSRYLSSLLPEAITPSHREPNPN